MRTRTNARRVMEALEKQISLPRAIFTADPFKTVGTGHTLFMLRLLLLTNSIYGKYV